MIDPCFGLLWYPIAHPFSAITLPLSETTVAQADKSLDGHGLQRVTYVRLTYVVLGSEVTNASAKHGDIDGTRPPSV